MGEIIRYYRIFLIVMLLMLLALPAYAETRVSDDGSEASSHNKRTDVINGFQAEGEYLIEEWHSRIRNLGNGTVEIYGNTRTNNTANMISVKITLQQWTGSSWQDLTSYTFNNTYTDYVWGLRNISVEKGKLYRVKGYHYAHDNFLVDETNSTTPSIYVE